MYIIVFSQREIKRPRLATDVIWHGPVVSEYKAWLQLIAKLALLVLGSPDPVNAIEKTTARGFVLSNTDHLPPKVAGRTHAVSVTHYSSQVAKVLGEMAAIMPKCSAGGFNTYRTHQNSPSSSPGHPTSVSAYRRPQILFEILGFGTDGESAPICAEWALQLSNKLAATDAALPASYLAITAPEFVDLEQLYGTKLDELKRLKKEYDPHGVFCNTLPKLVWLTTACRVNSLSQ